MGTQLGFAKNEVESTATVRKLGLSDVDAYTEIGLNAYTGLGVSGESRKGLGGWATNSVQNWPWQDLYGLFRGDKLLGGMCLFEFDMNVNSVIQKVGGIGSLAVDLLHKKEKVARDLVQFALQHYRDRGIPVVTLYPFDVSFYKRMGFGYGAQFRKYQVKPTGFPKGATKEHLEFMNSGSDRSEVLACYNRFYRKTNGLTEKLDKGLGDLFDFDENRIIGYRKDGELQGYMVLAFHKHHDFCNDLVIKELVYETPEALQEFMTFVHTQSDQFKRVIIRTQDEYFHYLINDPSANTYSAFESQYIETSVTGVGLMYRIVDVPKFFETVRGRNFNMQTCCVRFKIVDDFLKENAGEHIVAFDDGAARVVSSEDKVLVDTELTIGIAEFSSLMMGAVDFLALSRMGLARISNPDVEITLQSLFQSAQKPMCWLHF